MTRPVLTSEQVPSVERDALKAKLSLAREAMLVADSGDVLSLDRAVVKAHHKRHFGELLMPEDDTNIHIGDIVAPPANAQQQKKSGSSPILSGLIGAGLLASGIGIPFAGYLVANAIKNIKPSTTETVINPVTPGDGNTKYQLKLVP